MFDLDEEEYEIIVSLRGPDEPPPVDDLATLLDTNKEIRVRWSEIAEFTWQGATE